MSKQKQELSAEEETDEEFITRITQPRVWTTLNDTFAIQSIPEDRLEDVIDLFTHYYVHEEQLCIGNGLTHDQESVDQFIELVKHWISDTLSTIVIEKSSGKIVGVVVCRVCLVEDHSLNFSRLRLYDGKIWNEIHNFNNYLNQKVNIYNLYGTDAFCRIYAWFVLPPYRHRGLGTKLLESVIAKRVPEMMHFGCKVVSGIFTGKTSQRIAESLGLKTLYEANHMEWATQNNVQLNYNELLAENALVKVMAMEII
ncbi:uncharacterized protein LOC126844742 [Adelges cooleyi]|uniref:uncharacterized protein LOC126844742 n=1 Tax=Adelges cooleyi TaxID=133065 RepID=UPI0021800BFC|nr:uncharacterized protein LOC126844742 [Adelges cooleyi]